MSGASNSFAVVIPIFLVVAAFWFGVIELSPDATQMLLQGLYSSNKAIQDLVTGDVTLKETFEQAKHGIQETQSGSPVLEKVLKNDQISQSSKDDSSKPDFDPQEIEKLVHLLTNEQRIEHGFSELILDSEISDISRTHSYDMANRNYFSHETPEGLDPSGRAEIAGYSCQKMVGLSIYSGLAENIFQGNLYDKYYTINGIITSFDWNTNEEIAIAAVEGWMNSPGHRKNILTEMFDREGIGVIIDEDDKVYITQNFC